MLTGPQAVGGAWMQVKGTDATEDVLCAAHDDDFTRALRSLDA